LAEPGGSRLRVIQLVHGYPPAVGGVEFTVRDISERLVARNLAEVTVLTTDAFTNENFRSRSLPTVPIVEGESHNGVAVKRFPVETRWALPLRVLQKVAYELRLPGNDRLRTWYQGPICPGMLEALSGIEGDVICAASFPLNHMTYPFRTWPARPVVLIGAVHTNDPWGYERPNLIRLVGESFATIAFTEHERDWLVARGAPPERIRIIGLGVDPAVGDRPVGAFRAAHGIDASAFLVAYVGQQGSHKGIESLIGVLPRLLEERPDAWMVVGGARTPYSEKLAALAESMPAAARRRLNLLSDLTPESKQDLLVDCDVFASPSGHESFGLTTLEAWVHSRPVVVGDTPAQSEIVKEGVTGLLVPYRDEQRLLDALLRLARDPDLRRRLGAAGRAQVLERHTIDTMADRFAEVLREAAASGRR
jgi:glycosyltransferase involved in cell wall biosynthesis